MRKSILYSAVGVIVLLIFLVIVSTKKQDTTSTSSANIDSTAPAILDKQKVGSILTTSVDHYTQLFTAGKAMLGTTRYPNATAGLQALNDPNSTASKFASFRTDTCIKNDPGTNVINAYRDVSNLYAAAHVKAPDTLDNWNIDLNNAASDICLWAGDAIKWQISEITSTRLQINEEKITNDFFHARTDVDKMLGD